MKKNITVVLGIFLVLFTACKEVDTKLYPLNEEGMVNKTVIQDEFQKPEEGWHYAFVDTTSSELMVKYDADAVDISAVEAFLTKNNWLKIIVADTMIADTMVTDSLIEVEAPEVEEEVIEVPVIKKQPKQKKPIAHDSTHHAQSDSVIGW